MPLFAYRLFIRRDVLGFYYHVVSDERLPHIQHLYRYKSPRMFENDLIYLAKNFNLITYEQLAAHYSGGPRLKPKSVILTFDDGLSECYSVARPLLLKHGIPCVFFVTTDYIDNRKMCCTEKASLCIDRIMSLESSVLSDVIRSVNDALGKELNSETDLRHWIRSIAACEHSTIDWLCRLLEIDVQQYLKTRRPYMTSEEIRRLVEDGFSVGAHSVSHQKLGLLTDPEAEEDILASCRAIVSLSGESQVPFAFPFSADGVSRDMLRELRERHEYVGLLFDTNGILANRDAIISRMCGDWPNGASQDASNLPRQLVKAYLEDLALRVRQS